MSSCICCKKLEPLDKPFLDPLSKAFLGSKPWTTKWFIQSFIGLVEKVNENQVGLAFEDNYYNYSKIATKLEKSRDKDDT